jgi:micrococcal nuclease
MRSRRTKGLITVAALVGLAAIGGNAARGSDEMAPTGAAAAPTVTVARTPAPSLPTSSEADAARRATDAKKAADLAAAEKAAADKIAADTARAAGATWIVTKVVDGDTIWVARAGVSRKIRVIGIDTPETGQCGFSEARNALRGIIGGQRVTLTPGARDDVDRYGRQLRYVDVNGVDAGLRLIKQGYAVARYDSRDGYGSHTRETAYVRADAASPKASCVDPAAGTGGTGGPGGTSSTGGSGFAGSWPVADDRYPCPRSRPVKGNENSMIAHEPGDRYYTVTKPEQCFATMGDAEAAGLRPAKV